MIPGLTGKTVSRVPLHRIGWLAGLAAVGLMAGLAGCATRPEKAAATAGPARLPDRAWPPPPLAPRVVWVGLLHEPADFGIRRSWFVRMLGSLSGADGGSPALAKPFGVALDESGNLCLTDTGRRVVILADARNNRWRTWDRVGAYRFDTPVAVAKAQGILYVADSGLGCVLAFRENGSLVYALTNRLERPTGVALAGDRVLVSDAQRHCVVAFDRAGNYVAEFGRRGSGPGEFNYPTHLAVDGRGNLYVTDALNGRVQRLSADGRFLGQIGGPGDTPGFFGKPKGVAVDTFGHVYVVDASFDNIQIFDDKGRILLPVGAPGVDPGQFWMPNGIAIGRSNDVFVADCYNHRVQHLRYVGSADGATASGEKVRE